MPALNLPSYIRVMICLWDHGEPWWCKQKNGSSPTCQLCNTRFTNDRRHCNRTQITTHINTWLKSRRQQSSSIISGLWHINSIRKCYPAFAGLGYDMLSSTGRNNHMSHQATSDYYSAILIENSRRKKLSAMLALSSDCLNNPSCYFSS